MENMVGPAGKLLKNLQEVGAVMPRKEKWRSAPFLQRWMQQKRHNPNVRNMAKNTRAPMAGESFISKKCKPLDFL